MTPLVARIIAGEEDDNLLEHIRTLEYMRSTSARGLSPGEEATLSKCWDRLEQLTHPTRKPLTGAQNALAHLLMLEITGSLP